MPARRSKTNPQTPAMCTLRRHCRHSCTTRLILLATPGSFSHDPFSLLLFPVYIFCGPALGLLMVFGKTALHFPRRLMSCKNPLMVPCLGFYYPRLRPSFLDADFFFFGRGPFPCIIASSHRGCLIYTNYMPGFLCFLPLATFAESLGIGGIGGG